MMLRRSQLLAASFVSVSENISIYLKYLSTSLRPGIYAKLYQLFAAISSGDDKVAD